MFFAVFSQKNEVFLANFGKNTEKNSSAKGRCGVSPLERVAQDPARSFDFAQDDTAGAEARGQQYKARVAANEVWYDRAALLGR